MSYNSKLSNFVIAGVTAALLSSSAFVANAQSLGNAGAVQMEAELKADLIGVGLKYPAAQALTLAQVEELLAVFDVKEKVTGKPTAEETAAKADAATAILSRISAPVVASTGNAGVKQLEAELKADLDGAGIKHPSLKILTLAQVEELLAVFDGHDKVMGKPTAEETATKVSVATDMLEKIEHSIPVTMQSAGGMQLTTELKADLERVGLKYPRKALTLDQTVQLLSVFDMKDTAEIKKSADPIAERTAAERTAASALMAEL
ncbi:MAG: hypothetical protein H7245_14720 [Candidatus Saccharibacteria bacterium]|nr:hypothetical protein [Pseudorhodobacter sp.]